MLSVGNMKASGWAGILGISFAGQQKRLKVNGRAMLVEPAMSPYRASYPEARVWVRLDVREVIRNCVRRIPKMTFVE